MPFAARASGGAAPPHRVAAALAGDGMVMALDRDLPAIVADEALGDAFASRHVNNQSSYLPVQSANTAPWGSAKTPIDPCGMRIGPLSTCPPSSGISSTARSRSSW